MKRRKPEEIRQASAPGWFVTFSDLMSLLLAFFVALVSFSSIEVTKYRAMLGSLRGAFTSATGAPNAPPTSISVFQQQLRAEEEAMETANQIRRLASWSGVEKQIDVKATGEGVRLNLANPLLFDEGSDHLKPEITGFLAGLAILIRHHNPPGVLIEGHTDDTPIATERFPSNWELSSYRALNVLKLFQANGVPAERLAAIGYGEYRPRKPLPKSAPVSEKAVNRRVEILLKFNADANGGAGQADSAQSAAEVK